MAVHLGSPIGFARLPQELREKIWGFAMNDLPEIFQLAPGMKPSRLFYPGTLPAMAFIQASLFEEVFLVWMRTSVFNLQFPGHMPSTFVQWMDNFAGGRAWLYVKHLRFTEPLRMYGQQLDSLWGSLNAGHLVCRAITVKHITLTFRSLSTVIFNQSSGVFTRLKTIDEILETLNFNDVIQCEKLCTLLLVCCPTWRRNRCIEADDLALQPHDLFKPLLRWFKEEFAKRGRHVQVIGFLDLRGVLPPPRRSLEPSLRDI